RQHAVTADVGVDDAFDTIVFELLGQVHDLVARQLAPTVGGNLAVLGVQAHDDVTAKSSAGIAQETGILHRSRADDDVAQATVEVALDGVEVADAAAQLHGDLFAHLFEDRLDGSLIDGLAGESAIEVHQVQATRA